MAAVASLGEGVAEDLGWVVDGEKAARQRRSDVTLIVRRGGADGVEICLAAGQFGGGTTAC